MLSYLGCSSCRLIKYIIPICSTHPNRWLSWTSSTCAWTLPKAVATLRRCTSCTETWPAGTASWRIGLTDGLSRSGTSASLGTFTKTTTIGRKGKVGEITSKARECCAGFFTFARSNRKRDLYGGRGGTAWCNTNEITFFLYKWIATRGGQWMAIERIMVLDRAKWKIYRIENASLL